MKELIWPHHYHTDMLYVAVRVHDEGVQPHHYHMDMTCCDG